MHKYKVTHRSVQQKKWKERKSAIASKRKCKWEQSRGRGCDSKQYTTIRYERRKKKRVGKSIVYLLFVCSLWICLVFFPLVLQNGCFFFVSFSFIYCAICCNACTHSCIDTSWLCMCDSWRVCARAIWLVPIAKINFTECSKSALQLCLESKLVVASGGDTEMVPDFTQRYYWFWIIYFAFLSRLLCCKYIQTSEKRKQKKIKIATNN